jgi:hypothetical protein
MRLRIGVTVLAGSVALLVSATVGFAAGGGPPDNQGTQTAASGPPDNKGTQTAAEHKTGGAQPGPNASLPAKAKAYGRYCQGQSKTHVAGQQGTAFSQCVTALAKLANGNTTSPRTACAALSRKHVAGQHGTPFSQCVAAAAKLLKDTHS